MPDSDRLWTTVGSAGSLNQADLAKVTLHQSIVQLGTGLAPPHVAAEAASAVSEAALAPELQLPTIQAVVRYNVTPVDGLFFTPGSGLHYFLKLRCRGNVSARLVEVDLQTGAETQRILLNSNTANFQVVVKEENPTAPESKVMDFVEKAYYVEATLTASAVVIGHPAAIQIIKIQPDAIIQ
jgi:hypothetical protein